MVQDGRRVTSNQFGTEKPYTLGVTDQHFVATANRRQGFAHPCTHTHTHVCVFCVYIYRVSQEEWTKLRDTDITQNTYIHS